MIAVSRDFVLARSNNFDRVLAHQPADPALSAIEGNRLSNIKAKVLQFLSHAGTAITLQAQPVLFPNMG